MPILFKEIFVGFALPNPTCPLLKITILYLSMMSMLASMFKMPMSMFKMPMCAFKMSAPKFEREIKPWSPPSRIVWGNSMGNHTQEAEYIQEEE